MSALSAPAALSTGVAFLGGARPLRAKHTAAPARARNGAVTTRAFLGGLFSGGGPKQVRGENLEGHKIEIIVPHGRDHRRRFLV